MANLYIEKLTENAIVPTKAHSDDACYDVYADVINQRIVTFDDFNRLETLDISGDYTSLIIERNHRAIIPIGFKMCCDKGWKINIVPRSGLSIKKGVTLINCIGTVDAGFRDPIGVLLINHSDKHITINQGDRIAQIELQRVYETNIIEGKLPDTDSERNGGFGSSGR